MPIKDAEGFITGFTPEDFQSGEGFSQNQHSQRSSQPPYAWDNNGLGRYGSDPATKWATGRSYEGDMHKETKALEEAERLGFINAAERDWLVTTTDPVEKRSTIEKLLGYKAHTGGVLGTLDDLFGVIETFSGYRAILSASAAVMEGLKGKDGWGVAFSTQEFKRAWSGEMSEHGRTSYRDVLLAGGNEMSGKSGFAKSLIFDIALDPATYLTFGTSAMSKVSIGQAGKLARTTAKPFKAGFIGPKQGALQISEPTGQTAFEILKKATGSETIPANLTLSRWGADIYQLASREIIETQPRRMQEIIRSLNGAEDVFKRGGLDVMSPTDLTRASSNPMFRRAVTEYAVRNYDRLALRKAGFEDKASMMAGRDITETARMQLRRGPGGMFNEYNMSAIGGFMKKAINPIGTARDALSNRSKIAGGAKELFEETGSALNKDRGMRALGGASATGQALTAAITGDAQLAGAAVGTAVIAAIPSLAKVSIEKLAPTSALRWIDRSFRHGIERMPVEDAEIFQKLKGGLDVAVEGKRAELGHFFSAPVVQEVNHEGKAISRALAREERELIARHMDAPGLKLIEEGSPLYEPMKWTQDQFKQIAQQERELGLLGNSWEAYVTHFYGSKSAGSVVKWFKNSNRTRRLVAELDGGTIKNRNSFSMHRVIATFADAERVFGKPAREIMDTDIGSILARRWSASLRLQAKVRAQSVMIDRHGYSALGEGFKNSHAAMGEIGEKLGNLARNYVDLGPATRGSVEELNRVADSFMTAKLVKGVKWFDTEEAALKRIRSRRSKAGNMDDVITRDQLVSATREHNIKALSEISRSAFGKDAAQLSVGELGALRDYLSATIVKTKVAAESHRRIQGMFDLHRFSLTDISVTGGGAIRPDRLGHKLARDLPDYSERELRKMGEKLAKGRDSQALVANKERVAELRAELKRANAAAKESGDKAPSKEIRKALKAERAKTDRLPKTLYDEMSAGTTRKGQESAAGFRKLGEDVLAARGKQDPKSVRDVIEEGLETGVRKATALAERTKARGKGMKRYIDETIRPDVARSVKINKLVSTAKKALGDHNAMVAKDMAPHSEKLKRIAAEIETAKLRRKMVEDQVADGVFDKKGLVAAKERIAKSELKIDKLHRQGRQARKDLDAVTDGHRAETAKLNKEAETLQAEKDSLAEFMVEHEKDIERWIAGQKLEDESVDLFESAKALAEVRDRRGLRGTINKAGGPSQDTLIEGQWMVPEAWTDAIEQSFGYSWDPSSKIDQTLSAWQRAQLLWKMPLTLPFVEHHGRNAITNAFLVAGHVGLRMLNPKNWHDAAAVMAVGASRAVKGEGAHARSVTRTPGKPLKGISEPDLADRFGGHVIKIEGGGTTTASEIFYQATIRSITHGFVASEVDGVAGVFGDLMHGRLVPNVGLMRSAADSLKGRSKGNFAKAVKEEGLVGGVAVEGARVTSKGLGKLKDSMFTSARWAARKTEHVVDVPFRLALFTDAVKQGKTFDEAAEVVRKHLNDWSRLSNFERKYMRTAIPFYSWIQFSAERFLRDIVESPGAITTPLRGIRAVQQAMESDAPSREYQSDWMAERVGIWDEQGEGLYKRYLLNGINADEALRLVASLTEMTTAMGHKFSRLAGQDGLAWTVFAPDSNPADDMRFLAQMDFMTGTVIEGLRGRDFFTGAPTGTVDEILNEEGYSRYEQATHLVHPSTRDARGVKILRKILGVKEELDGDPKNARANATRRWLLGRSPPSRFIAAYERKKKLIVQSIEAGDEKEMGRATFDTALEALGTRAYAFDAEKQKLYYNRNRIEMAQKLLLNAGYYDKFGTVYRRKGAKGLASTDD